MFFVTSNPSVGLNFGTLGSTAAPAATSASSGGFGTGLFGPKSTTGFTLGGTNAGEQGHHVCRELVWAVRFQVLFSVSSLYEDCPW